MNNQDYFHWSGWRELANFGTIEMPFAVSIFGLVFALVFALFASSYLAKQLAEKTTGSGKGKKKKKGTADKPELPLAYGFLLGIVSLVLGQLLFSILPGPTFTQLGPIALRWYGLMFAIAFICGYYLGGMQFKMEGKPFEKLDTLLTYVVIGIIVGARLGHVIFYDPYHYFIESPFEIIAIWEGGLASHGAVAGTLLAIWLFARNNKEFSFVWCLDKAAIPSALGGGFVRLGNFFNSEIVGNATDVPWAVVFLDPQNPAITPVPRHPTMLYESLWYFASFGIMLYIYRRAKGKLPEGMLVAMFMMFVFSGRILLEFTKMRQAAFAESWPISMGQILSLPFFALGAWLFLRAREQARKVAA